MSETKCKFCGTDHVETNRKIDDMHTALLGRDDLGIPGLVNRVKSLEVGVSGIRENCVKHICAPPHLPPSRRSRFLKVIVPPASIVGVLELLRSLFSHKQ